MIKFTQNWCAEQDAKDPLRACRNRFDIPDGVIYMDGNSLGPLPVGVSEHVTKVVDQEWRSGLVKSWNEADWINLPERTAAKIAPLIGAAPHEVTLADSTSVNLFKAAAAACKLNPRRRQILSEPGNFPTDLYMMEGLTNFLSDDYRLDTVPRTDIVSAITDETAVVLLTQVHYITADMLDIAAITKAAHAQGALVVWDLSHSTGAVPIDLKAANADLAVGCGYKYLNGGPGAPAFIYVAERHLPKIQQPLSGWFGHQAPFDFIDTYKPDPGIKRMLTGTTGILAASALFKALDAFEGIDMASVRAKSVALTELFMSLAETKLSKFDIKLATPKSSAQRGSHVSLIHDSAYAVMQALIEHGVIGDFRAPNYLRFGITPLYLGYCDIFHAIETLQEIMESGIWRKARFNKKSAVT